MDPQQLLQMMGGAGGAGGGSRVGETAEVRDLAAYISTKTASCLNNDKESGGAQNIIGRDGLLKSDADVDEQLLLFIPFTEAVKLRTMSLKADVSGLDGDDGGMAGPAIVKLYVNRPHIDFSEAESSKPTQTLELTAEQLDGRDIPLKFTKFGNVRDVAVFVESNQSEAEQTFINRISFSGTVLAGFNMAEFKSLEHE